MLALIDDMKIAVFLIVVLEPIGAIPPFLATTNDQSAVQRPHSCDDLDVAKPVTSSLLMVVE